VTDRERVEAEIEEAVGVRWGNGCFAKPSRKKWGECPDHVTGERCPYCWGIAALRHQRVEGMRDAHQLAYDKPATGCDVANCKIRESADALEGERG